MPKTRNDLTEILQIRVSKEGKVAIERAADEQQTTVAEYSRQALYRASKFTRNPAR